MVVKTKMGWFFVMARWFLVMPEFPDRFRNGCFVMGRHVSVPCEGFLKESIRECRFGIGF